MKKLRIIFIPREKQKSKFDWADIEFDNCRVGKARCLIKNNDLTIYSIIIYPEFQGNGYGKEFVEVAKLQYDKIIADRVRFTAIGFWGKVGFILDKETDNWIYHKSFIK